MTLKGLMVIAYRYRKLLTEDDLDFILRDLVPADLFGGHSLSDEFKEYPIIEHKIPETENHLYMIESAKYLVNQLLFKRTGDEKYDKGKNGLTNMLRLNLNKDDSPPGIGSRIENIYERIAGNDDYQRNDRRLTLIQFCVITVVMIS